MIRKYVEDSNVVRVRVYGEFPKAEPDAFISLELAEVAKETRVELSGRLLHIGVDVVRLSPLELVGGYLTCKKYSKQNTTVGYAIYTAREYHALYPFINDVVIIVDDSGGVVTDQLEETVRSETFPFSIRIVPIGNRWIAEEKE